MKNICSAPIVSVDYLEKERARLDKVVLVGGGFDVLHEGHIRHLQKAKSLGNILIVHVTGDKRIKEKKGPERPIFPELRRATVISTVKFVDYVFVYNGRHYDQKIIDKLKPDILFFNQEGFDEEVKKDVRDLRNFEGKLVVSSQKKLDNSSRVIKALFDAKEVA